MTLILDTAPLVALANDRDPLHAAVRAAVRAERGELILPAPVAAEVDYLITTRLGRDAERRFLRDLAAGRFQVECLLSSEYPVAAAVDQQYADLALGLADLSVIILARRFETVRLLTLDERHFRAVRPLQGGAFILLPGREAAMGRS